MQSYMVTFLALGMAVLLSAGVEPCWCDQGRPVVAIDLEVSSVPDLSTIDSVYTGDAAYLNAFLVIDNMPGGFVTGYDLGFELMSPDSSVVNMGFNRTSGWVALDPTKEGFPSDITLPGQRTLAVVGYWRLALTRGTSSQGELHVVPNPENLSSHITLLDEFASRVESPLIYSAFVKPATRGCPWVAGITTIGEYATASRESRTHSYVPGQVVARFATGTIDFPGDIASPGTEAIMSNRLRRIVTGFGILGIERVFKRT